MWPQQRKKKVVQHLAQQVCKLNTPNQCTHDAILLLACLTTTTMIIMSHVLIGICYLNYVCVCVCVCVCECTVLYVYCLALFGNM